MADNLDPFEGKVDSSLIEMLMRSGMTEDELSDIDRKLMQAQALRNNALGGAEGRQAGNVYVAANPMEHIAKLMQFYGGQKQEGELSKQRSDVLAAERKAMNPFLDAVQFGDKGRPPEALRGFDIKFNPLDPNSIEPPKFRY